MSRYTDSVSRLNAAFALVPRGTPEKELRRIAREEYPYGIREHHPYKAWLKATNDVIATRLRLEQWNATGGAHG